MYTLSNRPATPRGLERTLNPVSPNALVPMGLMQSPAGVIMFDTELRIVWVNEAAERLTGGPPATEWAGCRLGEVVSSVDADLIERSLQGCWRPVSRCSGSR
jgi:PAS domain-containing protein